MVSTAGSALKNKKRAGLLNRLIFGASDLTRTGDLLITSEMHYRLCYTSVYESFNIIPIKPWNVNKYFLKGFCGNLKEKEK